MNDEYNLENITNSLREEMKYRTKRLWKKS